LKLWPSRCPKFTKFCRVIDWNIRNNFYFSPTSKSKRIASYKFWDKFKFESSLNFKGIQTFLEKSDKLSKILSSHDILEYEFILTHSYSKVESSFTSENRYLVYFILNRADHLRVLPPLSQVYHYFKMDKECSKLNYEYCTSITLTCIPYLAKSKKNLDFQKW
jgi:hypothetical protein